MLFYTLYHKYSTLLTLRCNVYRTLKKTIRNRMVLPLEPGHFNSDHSVMNGWTQFLIQYKLWTSSKFSVLSADFISLIKEWEPQELGLTISANATSEIRFITFYRRSADKPGEMADSQRVRACLHHHFYELRCFPITVRKSCSHCPSSDSWSNFLFQEL